MIVINFSGSKANAHALNLTWTTYIYTNITHRESMIIYTLPPPLTAATLSKLRGKESFLKLSDMWRRRRNFECDC